ncbi:MAG: Anti-sigma factor RskA [Candidatus Acidoferrum typicum]|nr:Anti-sigma factor RskA [Candidatus Acidoferrum typicum]
MLKSFGSNTGTPNGHNGRDRHQHFRELCALYTSGSLNPEEMEQLNEHLHACPECTELLQEYSQMVRQMVPAFADEHEIESTSGFDSELACGRSRLLASVDEGARSSGIAAPEIIPKPSEISIRARNAIACVVATVLIVSAAIIGYVVGSRAPNPVTSAQVQSTSPVQAVAPSTHAGRANDADVKRLMSQISRLESDVSQAKSSIKELEQVKGEQAEAISRLTVESSRIKSERNEISDRLENAQTKTTQINQDVDRLRGERDDAVRSNSELNKTVEAARARLQTLSDTISEQERLLAADRDIRELMGARDLLLADVFDIDPNGKNRRPFGRIFYTKHKSLIFYAFDLDKQPGLQNAGAFQVWGARAADNGKGSAFNMGIFYMDNQAMRRWVLKFDDPKILAQIDSIFVTVEPHGGSSRPSGKQLLFASLRGEPNHP